MLRLEPRRAAALIATLAAALILSAAPLLHVATNRLVEGEPVSAPAALGGYAWPVAACTLAGLAMLAARSRVAATAACVLCGLGLILLAVGLGAGAAQLTAGHPPAVRARLAAGAWSLALLLGGGATAAARAARVPAAGAFAPLALAAILAAVARSGVLDALSLAVELRARHDALAAALGTHIALSLGALALAGTTIGLLAPWRRGRALVDLAVSGIQVVPAVALLGALVAATAGLLALAPGLRTLGLAALGPGPAIVAVAAYLLLPLWRGLAAALRAPDPDTLDAADAIGLTPRQTLLRVRLPLGAPLLVGAVRVAAVQAIGLATLGALVGAGGLGTLVFDGMAQFAPDLILLGTLPVIGLSLAAETGLSALEGAARRRWRS